MINSAGASAASLRTLATSILADALACGDPNAGFRFEYGWVRGLGSIAFLLGSLAAGQAVEAFGIGSVVIAPSILLLIAAGAALFVPEISLPRGAERHVGQAVNVGVLDLLQSPSFRWLIVVASLILGSHGMHDSFAMIAWNAAGISPVIGSVLWSESVAAEVIVLLAVGPFLLRYLTPEIGMVVAAVASLLRWGVLAESSNVIAIAAAEPLHGLTFALLHLSCMRALAAIVPRKFAGLAQSIYGMVGVGLTSAVLTLISGWLYTEFGIRGFWGMFITSLVALPAIWQLSRVRSRPSTRSSGVGRAYVE